MRTGDKIFSVTYYVNYALTNSHHSIAFRNNDRIDVSKLFEEIRKIYYPKRNEITEVETFLKRSESLRITQIPRPISLLEPKRINDDNDINKLVN